MTLRAILPADSINKTNLCNMNVYRVLVILILNCISQFFHI